MLQRADGAAPVAVPAVRRRAGRAAAFPLGRRTPKGRLRWYVLRVPQGREDGVCASLKRLVPHDLLEDAFVPRRERWMKRGGVWFLEPVSLYAGYAFALSRDAGALAKVLSRLSVPVELVGTEERAWAPLDDRAAAWLAGAMDAQHVIRSSTAVIVDGELHVQEGPLVGQEARVRKVDRHRRRCQVAVCDGDGGFTVSVPIDVPFKS